MLRKFNRTWQSTILLSNPVFTSLLSKTCLPRNYPVSPLHLGPKPAACVISIHRLLSFTLKGNKRNPAVTPHLSPAVTSFFCLPSRKSFCNYCLCLFTPRCFLSALRLGFCVPEPLRPHLSCRPIMSALPQSSADCSVLNLVGLSAAFDRADHAESWRESLPGRENCKHNGPEIETEEKVGVVRAQRVGGKSPEG